MTTSKSLEELVQEVTISAATFAEAQRVASKARVAESTCLNRLNSAQKEIDERILDLRKSAPRGSDWGARGAQQYPKPM